MQEDVYTISDAEKGSEDRQERYESQKASCSVMLTIGMENRRVERHLEGRKRVIRGLDG